MDTIVLKFGGSSVADNIKLSLVTEKIIELYEQNNNVVVVVSAQGKTTDNLIKEANELSAIPNEREMDVLLSTGEQITISKLSILLNRLGYDAVSLTGWQAGIITNNVNQNAIIENIDTTRIEKELKKRKIVVVAGFQGINKSGNITTLGRGGSDTTAVALAAALKAKHCYIFSDVDGVYTTDPNKVTIAKKLNTLSYEEMIDISSEGAKVLHNRCVEVGEKFNIPIITKSTFNNKPGTVISNKIEEASVKSIVKNNNITLVKLKSNNYSINLFNKFYETLIKNNLFVKNLNNRSKDNILDIDFYIHKDQFTKFSNILENNFKMIDVKCFNISRISLIGHGINNNNNILNDVFKFIELNNIEILNIDITESKISIVCNKVLSDEILKELHEKIIK